MNLPRNSLSLFIPEAANVNLTKSQEPMNECISLPGDIMTYILINILIERAVCVCGGGGGTVNEVAQKA